MLMSVLERTREFGVLLALGTEPVQVLRTLLYEAVILGILACWPEALPEWRLPSTTRTSALICRHL